MGNKPTIHLSPEVLSDLRDQTDFTEEELKEWYKDFMNDCPNGRLTRQDFQGMYSKFFPSGNATEFTEHVFRTFDTDWNNTIDFREFMCGMSVLMKGSVDKKLDWIFNLFDVDRNGYISKSEMVEMLLAMNKMMGHESAPTPLDDKSSPESRTDIIFGRADRNCDGYLSREEFLDAAKNDQSIMATLQIAI